MKPSSALLLLLLLLSAAQAQTFPKWAWIKGDSLPNTIPGIYGTRGVANAANKPEGRSLSMSWTDNAGNLWLMGGHPSRGGYYNDLWKYNVRSNEWAWMKGDSTWSNEAITGTPGVPAEANTPFGRMNGATWTDLNGKLWLFGGHNEKYTSWDHYNDLWKYDPATNQWAWMKGSLSHDQFGVYGTKGDASNDNMPGSREGSAFWTDAAGNLWLFGGEGVAGSINYETHFILLNDLWKYSVSNNQWTWMHGDNVTDQRSVYGTVGIASPANKPGSRQGSATWKDASGNFWLFGGVAFVDDFIPKAMNDLWKYDLSNNQWTWMGGDTTGSTVGVYGTKGIATGTNQPGSRWRSSAFTDAEGKFWLMGGQYNDIFYQQTFLNDTWKYDPDTHMWAWMSGDNTPNKTGVYGTIGIPNANNKPGARASAASWSDKDGIFWVFGGNNGDTYLNYSDLWKLTVSNLCDWTGTVSDQWEDPANWSCGKIPGAGINVYIPSGTVYSPVIRSAATCFTITASPGATFTIAAGFTLNVTGP